MALRRLLVAFGLVLGWAVLWAAPAAAQSEVLLGTRDVDLTLERDRIDVSKAQGRFREIRLYAQRNGILISRVAVHYSDGTVHNEERRINLLPGERTRPIDPGSPRFIDHIDLFYRTNPGATGTLRHAVVEVRGLQNDDDRRAARPARPGGVGPVAGVPGQVAGGAAAVVAPPGSRPIQATPVPRGRCGGPGEQFLGSGQVALIKDLDKIAVGPERGKFDLIRLCVYDGDIDLLGVRVNYIQGEAQNLPYAGMIKANSRTQELRFKGDRFIRDVDILYKRAQINRSAFVEIWGEYAEGWIDNEAPKYRGGWVVLSSHTARFLGFDKDIAAVPTNKGGFTKIKVDVRDRDITLRKLTVTYVDGSKEDLVAARTKVDQGKDLILDLKGVRPIGVKEIEAHYRSHLLDRDAKGRGRAIVEISGRR